MTTSATSLRALGWVLSGPDDLRVISVFSFLCLMFQGGWLFFLSFFVEVRFSYCFHFTSSVGFWPALAYPSKMSFALVLFFFLISHCPDTCYRFRYTFVSVLTEPFILYLFHSKLLHTIVRSC